MRTRGTALPSPRRALLSRDPSHLGPPRLERHLMETSSSRNAVEVQMDAIDSTWRSWRGIHGGYGLAIATATGLRRGSEGPRAIRGSFLAPMPVGEDTTAHVSDLRIGSSTAETRIEVRGRAGLVLDILATFDKPRPGIEYERWPAMQVSAPEDCPQFNLPVDLIPFASHIEVRPTNDRRPLAGGSDPELSAWVRIVDADLQPWQAVTTLLDALPPALYAVATTFADIPSTMMAVSLTQAAQECCASDWFLVQIRADVAAEGWAVETSNVWSRHGALLGHASQQRRVLSALH